jgi:hypothetical protein
MHRHAHTHTRTHTHTRARARAHARVFTQTRTHTHTCKHVCVCVCLRARACCGCVRVSGCVRAGHESVCLQVCERECLRVSESVRLRVRAGLCARPRTFAGVCGSVHADVWGPCVFECVLVRAFCVRAQVRVCVRARARVSMAACVRVRVRVRFAVPSASIFSHVLRVRVRHDFVCAPRRCAGAVEARRGPAVLIARPAAPGGRACAFAVRCDRL